MSTLWTPGGEHVPRPQPASEEKGPVPPPGPDGRELSPEEFQAALAQAQAEILATPVLDHVANHAMGLFELAVLHLQGGPDGTPPNLDEARLAIDALAALAEGLGARLEKYDQPLTEALSQLRMAYVRVADG